MSVANQIQRTFKVSFDKEWYETYWAFDIHGTILKPTYDLNEDEMEFYPYAKEALQKISKRKDCAVNIKGPVGLIPFLIE
jgi:cytochrome b involved in lipid metabolism